MHQTYAGHRLQVLQHPSVCAWANITFTDYSTGASSWFWQFGDGTTSTLQNPTHTYTSWNTYLVTLQINGGASSVSKEITVVAQPYASFLVEGIDDVTFVVCSSSTLNFSDASSDSGSSPITSWYWTFGDGTTSSLMNPSHVYTGSSLDTVHLTVSNVGCSSTNNSYVLIKSYAVTASFDTSIASAVCSSTVLFNNTTIPLDSETYTWTFGDGSPTSNVISPSHTFPEPATYDVKLVAQNYLGCSDSVTVPIQVLSSTAVASLQSSSPVCQNSAINFLNTSVPAPVSSTWSFGDATTSDSINPTKTFVNPGAYSVLLTNNYGACEDSATVEVIVSASPTANFSDSILINCSLQDTVNFTDMSTGAETWFWNFGDGTIASIINPSHIYYPLGDYTVKLTVSNATGCFSSDSLNVNTTYFPAKPGITWTGSILTTNATNVNYQWLLNDTVIAGANSADYTPLSDGLYKLQVTGLDGCINTSDSLPLTFTCRVWRTFSPILLTTSLPLSTLIIILLAF